MRSRIVRFVFFSAKAIQTKQNNTLSLVHTRKQNDDDEYVYKKKNRENNTKHTQNHLTPIK